MSIMLMARVWELDLPHAQSWVLMALTDHAADDGTRCYPSVKTLSWKTGYSERYVQALLQSLREQDIITPVAYETGGRGKSTHYHIHLENASLKDEPTDTLSDEKGEPGNIKRVNPSTERVNPSALKGEPQFTRTTKNHQEPSEEPPGCGVDALSVASTNEVGTSDVSEVEELPNDPRPAFEPPGFWAPLTTLEGYVRRDYSKTVRVFEDTCTAQGVEVAEVIATFAEYYAGNRYRHGWSDPVKALRRTLPVQISKLLTGRSPPSRYQTPHQKRIAAEKALPQKKFTVV